MRVKRCPRCGGTREVSEALCRGTFNGGSCGWNLISVRPVELENDPALENDIASTRDPAAAIVCAPDSERAELLSPIVTTCPHGHAVGNGDFLCPTCGAEIPLGTEEPEATEPAPGEVMPERAAPIDAQGALPAAAGSESETPRSETEIAGFRSTKSLGRTGEVRERHLVEHPEHGTGVLTLYRAGAEPDPEVYEVLQRMDLDHVPRIIEFGRFEGRPYEVVEHLTGGNLADLEVDPADDTTVRAIVQEIARALDDFARVGLRHRDLRPEVILVRRRDPLDLVVGGFGSARLSEFDLDVVSPLEATRYMAPEAIAGGVAPASDWWSLGMILLEKLTQGRCFEGVSERAFLIHLMTNGVPIPGDLPRDAALLLRGLLTRDRSERWQGRQVRAWLAKEPVQAPPSGRLEHEREGPAIDLRGTAHRRLSTYTLAAADAENWSTALQHLVRGKLAAWAEDIGLEERLLATVRSVLHRDLDHDMKLAIALKAMNPNMPLVHRGDLVTPGWLTAHPEEAYRLITGDATDILAHLGAETWLRDLKSRARAVRSRAQHHQIEVEEAELRIYVLSTSRANLLPLWEERRRLFPSSDHRGLAALMHRRQLADEDLIILLSASLSQFVPIDEVLAEAGGLAREHDVTAFDEDEARRLLEAHGERGLLEVVSARVENFARCGHPEIDQWVERFRLEHRLTLARALTILAVPEEQWVRPASQLYIQTLVEFFEQKIALSIKRGGLTRMTISRNSTNIDLTELGSARRPAAAALNRILDRSDRAVDIDPAVFDASPILEARVRNLHNRAQLYRRDTGIDGLYLGFPFFIFQPAGSSTKPRIAPVLLWPVKLTAELGRRGLFTLTFASDREEVRLNPALDGIVGPAAAERWLEAAEAVLGRVARIEDVVDEFGRMAPARGRELLPLPGRDEEVPVGPGEIVCSAVLLHVAFMGQAVLEDLRHLKRANPEGTALEPMLRLSTHEPEAAPLQTVPEAERFFTVPSDPSQESSVLRARESPGLLIEGPPGTGKSQTIVNIVGDAIGRGRSLLLVCQKQAALDVVKKRLDAQGLGSRVVMVTDVHKDRKAVVQSVREQVEKLRERDSDIKRLKTERSRVATRIETLEGELDDHHHALHATDEVSGRSYREIVSELVALEDSERPPIPSLTVRRVVGEFAPDRLSAVEEACAPLGRNWVEADFEKNPLAATREFGWDAATIDAFTSAFGAFEEAESRRWRALEQYPAPFDVGHAQASRSFIARWSQALASPTTSACRDLATWIDLFTSPSEAPSAAQTLRDTLAKLIDDIDATNAADHDDELFGILRPLPEGSLARWIECAALASKPPGLFARLNPFRLARRRRFEKLLATEGLDATESRRVRFLAAGHLEQAVRPLRGRLSNVAGRLSRPTQGMDSSRVAELRGTARQLVADLDAVAPLAAAVEACPVPELARTVVATASPESLASFVVHLDAACHRAEARATSETRLEAAAEWMQDAWISKARAAIQHNESLAPSLTSIRGALGTLPAYQTFRRRARELSDDARTVFRALDAQTPSLRRLPHDEIEPEIRRILARESRLAWKARVELAHPVLLHDRTEIASKTRTLARADEKMRLLNQGLLEGCIDVERLGDAKKWDDITRLSGPRVKRLREFFDTGIELGLLHLRPVWLMNPDVASRLLPRSGGLFDIVVFDEASQMPVEYALPTLFRGRTAVVSGDEKQLPPTAFFSSRIENDEAELAGDDIPEEDATDEEIDAAEEAWNRREIKDCSDLLMLARSTLPRTMLEIHYRSEYRELIAFSNAAFYGNRLNVPPQHPNEKIVEVKPLEMLRVDGLYQQQTNPEEGKRVVALLADYWSAPADKRPSIGVVTFNRKQADLIDKLLEARAEEDPAFRDALEHEFNRVEEGEDMGFFVKNVENVQGDERDIIVFSTTFGRNSEGVFRRNFGVLGQRGGERRLNVAVTRAREKVVLATSIPIDDVSDMITSRRAPSVPRDYLQAYLYYAARVSEGALQVGRTMLRQLVTRRNLPDSTDSAGHDGFVRTVRDFVRKLGYEPVAAHDGTAFGVDFAIRDPRTGLFGIGIECDAPKHPILARARAREIWRPKVLAKSIPRIHRVSSYGWYHTRDRETELLRTAITEALHATETKP